MTFKIPLMFDPAARAARNRQRAIAQLQAQFDKAERHHRFVRRVKIFSVTLIASGAGLAGLLIYLANSSVMDEPPPAHIVTVATSPAPTAAPPATLPPTDEPATPEAPAPRIIDTRQPKIIYIGPRGGRYHYSASGKKVYERRK